MASVTWPSTLPQAPLLSGFRETPPDNLLRTEMDVGPAKTRRRTTSSPRPVEWPCLMSLAQVNTFEAFYKNTIRGGALRFNITHPRTGASVEARITEVEAYRALSHNIIQVSITMEFFD